MGDGVVRVGRSLLMAAGCGALLVASSVACSSSGKKAGTTPSAASTNNAGDDNANTTEAAGATEPGAPSAPVSSTETATAAPAKPRRATTATSTSTTVSSSAALPKSPRVVARKLRTTQSPAKMSEFLVKPAASARKGKRFDVAIPLFRGLVAARGQGSREAYELAVAWTDQGDFDQGKQAYAEFISHTSDLRLKSQAERELANLRRASNPFAKQFKPNRGAIQRYAVKAFQLGRTAYRKKRYADAQLYFQMGAAINPDLPGFLRELGATYDKLGMTRQKIEFYYRYLRQRPFGKNAETIRKELSKTRGLLSTLTVVSAIPCQELWINGQQIRRIKLPMRVLVAPGRYRGLCLHYPYAFGMFHEVQVARKQPQRLEFRWAVVENGLQNPSGRIAIEHAANGNLMNLDLGAKKVGVMVPANGRALKVVLKPLDGSPAKTRYIKLTPGQKEVIKW